MITADGLLPWFVMMICRAASRTASSAGEGSRTMRRPGLPWSSTPETSTLFIKVSSMSRAPPSPASAWAGGTRSRPLASSVTRSKRSSARSTLPRYSAEASGRNGGSSLLERPDVHADEPAEPFGQSGESGRRKGGRWAATEGTGAAAARNLAGRSRRVQAGPRSDGGHLSPARAGADVHPLALRSEQNQQFGGLRSGAAEPVRGAGIELGSLARLQNQVELTEPPPQPPGEQLHPPAAYPALLLAPLLRPPH